MKVGLDLDNTVVCYDRCFHALAHREFSVPDHVPISKRAVRQFFRDSGREKDWTILQGIAYGRGMDEAIPFDGALDFVRAAVANGLPLSIISHRTAHPIVGDQTDLHASARDWLRRAGFIGDGALSENDVFFETTKEAKLRRIAAQGCNVFLDDLPEILRSPLFPATVEGWLFDPNAEHTNGGKVVRDWDSFRRHVL